MLLRTEKLTKHFGGLRAVDGIDFELQKGEVRGLIGPNGSGKSTFFNLVSGIYRADEGSRVFIDGRRPPARSRTRSRPAASPARFSCCACSRR